ncbi:MAG: phosphate ABC transporter substrate-binding protein [Myxococcales bacterium]|nr:phosphate ABC transporter substrate-binding protein [Myxococcales bacterium]
MKRVFLAIGMLALGACRSKDPASGSSGPEAERKLVLTGSSTIAPLASEIAKRFEAKHPGVRVDIQTGGSARGISDALAGLADIGMASRELNPDEAANGLTAIPIAKDGIGLIVHRDNALLGLTRQQLVSVYTGQVTNWRQVGGKDARLTVVNKAEGRATLELFLHFTGLKSTDIQASVVIGDNAQGIKTVAGNPDAIGYVSIGTAEHDASLGTPIRLISVDGVAASLATVGDGTFPMSRALNLVVKGQPNGLARDFIEYSRSAEVHDLVKAEFFVPLGPTGT